MTGNTKIAHYVEKEDLYITPTGRTNFVALSRKFKKRGSPDDSAQYVVSIMFAPGTDLELLKKAADEACMAEHKVALFGPKRSKSVRNPFIDANEKDVEIIDPATGEPMDLTGWIMLRCNGKLRRPVVRNSVGDIVKEEDLDTQAYSGRWMRLMVRPGAYEVDGAKGVKFYLEGVQLLRNDEPVGKGGGASTGEAFGAADEGDDAVDPLA